MFAVTGRHGDTGTRRHGETARPPGPGPVRRRALAPRQCFSYLSSAQLVLVLVLVLALVLVLVLVLVHSYSYSYSHAESGCALRPAWT